MKPPKKTGLKQIYIEWHDSYSIDQWCPILGILPTIQEPMVCYTVGFQLSKSKDVIITCHTFNQNDQACGILQIPRKCIIKIEYL